MGFDCDDTNFWLSDWLVGWDALVSLALTEARISVMKYMAAVWYQTDCTNLWLSVHMEHSTLDLWIGLHLDNL